MLNKITLLLITLIALSACASDFNEGERLGECIIDGNVDQNCELKTIEYGHQK